VVGLLLGHVLRCRVIVGTCSAISAFCRGVFCEVWFVREVFGDVGLVSGLARRCRVIIGSCSAMSAFSRDVFDEVL